MFGARCGKLYHDCGGLWEESCYCSDWVEDAECKLFIFISSLPSFGQGKSLSCDILCLELYCSLLKGVMA